MEWLFLCIYALLFTLICAWLRAVGEEREAYRELKKLKQTLNKTKESNDKEKK